MDKPQSYRLYKANKSGNGAASQWDLSYKSEDKYSPWKVFVKIAAQTKDDENGNARFLWDEGITVCLGLPDIGAILTVLDGRSDRLGEKGLYHSVEKGSSKIINLNFNEGSFDFSISKQDKEKNNTRLYHRITEGEGMILSIILKSAVNKILNW